MHLHLPIEHCLASEQTMTIVLFSGVYPAPEERDDGVWPVGLESNGLLSTRHAPPS